MFRDYLELIARNGKLSDHDFQIAFDALLEGKANEYQAGAFLLATRMAHENARSISYAAQQLRARAASIQTPPGVLDIVGTGGDGLKTLNISTAAAIVAAAAGATVAKHGNFGATGPTGAADVVSALGVNLSAPIARVQDALFDHKFAFIFAPLFHSKLKRFAQLRRSLEIRTIFNLLGPLINPVAPEFMLLGTSTHKMLEIYADIMPALGVKHAWIVCGDDGMDELSLCASTDVVRYENGNLSRFQMVPEEVGLPRARHEDIQGGHAEYNAKRLRDMLGGEHGAYRDAVVYNAGAALLIAGIAGSPLEGIRVAEAAIDDGRATRKLDEYILAVK
jgi:anthranilate phosphoribosyltransferase